MDGFLLDEVLSLARHKVSVKTTVVVVVVPCRSIPEKFGTIITLTVLALVAVVHIELRVKTDSQISFVNENKDN